MRKPHLYLQLASELAEQIADGTLPAGTKLPPQRDVAHARGITTGTVLRAYAELQRQGLIESVVGRGSFVRRRSLAAPVAAEVDLRANRPPLRSLVHHLTDLVARQSERFDECLLTDRVLPSNVQDRHENAAARWLARYHGVDTPSGTLLCNSAQQALTCSMLTLCKPGDVVAAEESVYLGVILLAGMLGLKLVPIALDRDGMSPGALATACKRDRPKVVFCMPNLQSPTTATIPEERRRSIAALAREHDFWVVEDDVLGSYVEQPLPPFRALLPERSILFTSFSKVIALGAAAGILSVPPQLQDQISANIRVAGGTVNPLFWEAMTLLIDGGQLDDIIIANRAEVRARVAIAQSILGEAGLVTKSNCPHAWLPLPPSTTLSDFMLRAQSRNIKLMRSDQFAVRPSSSRAAVRITLGGARDRTVLTNALIGIKQILQLSLAEVPMA